MPGAGKTQFILSAILSMCMANSPQRISLIIADMKAVDTMPLANLPHLAMPIVTDTERIVTVLGALVDEMTVRMMRAAAGDRSFLQHSICVVVDEIAELIVGGAQGELAATHIQRLSQAGRGVGIILILATQRVFDIPAKVYSKIDRRCVFRVASASDSVAASGSEGTRCNKLPKRGALEIFSAGDPTAQRAQGLFVADAEADDYEATLHGFVEDIAQRWGHMQPAWKYTPRAKEAQPDEPTNELDALYAKYGDEFVDALVDMAEEGKLTGRAVGNVYQKLTGKSMNNDTRNNIRDIILQDFE
jgi:DNA segregation ATPase FtsK/SpoIIIE-like protein